MVYRRGSFVVVSLPVLLFVGLLACKTSSSSKPSLFEDVAKQTGIDFWQFSGATGEMLLPEMVGSGAALIDYDNDGDMDVFLVQGYPTAPQGKPLVPVPPGWKPGNRLFRNNLTETGKLTFTDVTESAGVGYADKGMGVAAGDYDNDGYVDLYVTNYAHNILYHNNGNGTFTDVTAERGCGLIGLVHQRRLPRLRPGWPAGYRRGSLCRLLSPALLHVRRQARLLRSFTVSKGQRPSCIDNLGKRAVQECDR